MNEQLVVKNFGPIKDATVDFKRVTVFIGPTGGGKSTLAKLAAIFRGGEIVEDGKISIKSQLKYWSLNFFEKALSEIIWNNKILPAITISVNSSGKNEEYITAVKVNSEKWIKENPDLVMTTLADILKQFNVPEELFSEASSYIHKGLATNMASAAFKKVLTNNIVVNYIPAERVFVAAIEYSWAGLISESIGLSKPLLEFANNFSTSRKEVLGLDIPFLNIYYQHSGGRDFIKIPEREEPLMLLEAASGIQSVTPLLVLLEHLSRNTEQVQSFIIEEPELNLFPIAQFELVKTLVEKCARLDGQNDLVLTTHSPYVLTALNLMCYAFRIAQQDEATAKKVAKLIPRHCWIDPEQFAAYYVDRPDTKRKQQVRSIINKKTGLIEENELDTASEELSNIFDKLLDLRQPVKSVARAR